MGVWIETSNCPLKVFNIFVTPCMGVWIETLSAPVPKVLPAASHPVWVCGLKPAKSAKLSRFSSHTLYGCVD